MTIDKVVSFLNNALDQDNEVVSRMFLDIFVPADQEMIDHPTVQVTIDDKLRLIGLLNGLVSDGKRVIKMTLDEDGLHILRFDVAEKMCR